MSPGVWPTHDHLQGGGGGETDAGHLRALWSGGSVQPDVPCGGSPASGEVVDAATLGEGQASSLPAPNESGSGRVHAGLGLRGRNSCQTVIIWTKGWKGVGTLRGRVWDLSRGCDRLEGSLGGAWQGGGGGVVTRGGRVGGFYVEDGTHVHVAAVEAVPSEGGKSTKLVTTIIMFYDDVKILIFIFYYFYNTM
jgi:hypothetical protein